MRISLATRAARACAAATLVFSLGLAPSYARMGGPGGGGRFAGPASGFGHSPRSAPRGLNPRFNFDRFHFRSFGPERSDRFGFNRFGHGWSDRSGFSRFNRFQNQLLIGGWGWGGWVPAPTATSEPVIVVDTPPVLISLNSGPGTGGGGQGSAGSCVIHKLNYDRDGKYVGERQIPHC